MQSNLVLGNIYLPIIEDVIMLILRKYGMNEGKFRIDNYTRIRITDSKKLIQVQLTHNPNGSSRNQRNTYINIDVESGNISTKYSTRESIQNQAKRMYVAFNHVRSNLNQ